MFAVAYARLVTAAEGLLGLGFGPQHCSAEVLRQANWLFSLGTLAVMRSMFLRRMVSRRFGEGRGGEGKVAEREEAGVLMIVHGLNLYHGRS